MSWTPGPWKVTGFNDKVEGSGHFVAHDIWSIEDTRLISLAPEMAELLQHIVGNLESWDTPGMLRHEENYVLKNARDILARARGEDAQTAR